MNESELVDGAEYEGPYCADGKIVRGRVHRGRNYFCFRTTDDSRRRVTLWQEGDGFGYHAYLDSLRPVSSPPAIAEKDRLHESPGICCLCGKETNWRLAHSSETGKLLANHSRANPGCWLCSACGAGEIDVQKADREITRRKQLAANAQPAAIEPVNAETPKPDPYVKHREDLGLSPTAIAQATANRDRGDTDKQRQAFRELDRGIKGPKYVYAESSVVFSTSTWESD
jgi:hypothetical protein